MLNTSGRMMFDAIVVGAGLSGCVCASRLKADFGLEKVLLLETLDRIGGRTFSPNGVDLGAAWSWPSNDKELGKLIDELGLERISQDVEGESIGQTHDGKVVRLGASESPSGPGSFRIKGGTGQVCTGLVEKYGLEVKLLSQVVAISVSEVAVSVEFRTTSVAGDASTCDSTSTVSAKAVVLAIPANHVPSINFNPNLPQNRIDAFRSTPTWMGNAGKVCLNYGTADKAFWRSKMKLNGTMFSRKGPVVQAWDNSDSTQAVLCGFVFDEDLVHLKALKDSGSSPGMKSPILDQLETIFGREVLNFKSLTFQSWDHMQPLTGSRSKRSEFGDVLVRIPHEKKIFFAGTESVPFEHGHMEGAVVGGIRSSQEVAHALGLTPLPRHKPQ